MTQSFGPYLVEVWFELLFDPKVDRAESSYCQMNRPSENLSSQSGLVLEHNECLVVELNRLIFIGNIIHWIPRLG